MTLNTELAACHTSGAQNLEVAPRFLENLCTSSSRAEKWHGVTLNTELAACHTSGAQNLEVAPRFLENLCTSSSRAEKWHGVVGTSNSTATFCITSLWWEVL